MVRKFQRPSNVVRQLRVLARFPKNIGILKSWAKEKKRIMILANYLSACLGCVSFEAPNGKISILPRLKNTHF